MENKKLDELEKTPLSREETYRYLGDMLVRLQKNRQEIKDWTDNLKKQYGAKDEDL